MNVRLEGQTRLILVAIAALSLSGVAACDSSGGHTDMKAGSAGTSDSSGANGTDDDGGTPGPELAAQCELALRQAFADAQLGIELTDAQIAAVIRDANLGEIAHGELALLRAEDGDVRDFASRMVNDHGASNEALYNLLATLRLRSEENPASAGLTAEAMRLLDTLTPLTGSEFDRAYIDGQVLVHTAVLAVVERTLLPSVDDDQMRTYLETVRTAVMQHLQAARMIQAGLSAAEGG